MQAEPLEGIPEALVTINRSNNTKLALISGRPVAEIQTLLRRQDFVIAGTHGWELFTPAHGIDNPPLSSAHLQTLELACREATALIDQHQVERKLATVAVHTRSLPLQEADAVTANISTRWNKMQASGEFEIRKFDGGVEFRVKGRTKADAVRDILSMWPGRRLVVYIGDDDTDEDAFSYLYPWGIGIRVGRSERQSAATGRLHSIEEVRQLLWNWINSTR